MVRPLPILSVVPTMSFSFGFGGGGADRDEPLAGCGSDAGADGGSSLWGGAALHYEAAAAAPKRAGVDDAEEEGPARQRRRTAAPAGPPPNPPPSPGCPWPDWCRPQPFAASRAFTLEGKSYSCPVDSQADGRSRVHQQLRDGSRGPPVGWRGDDGDLSLEPGEWSGELLDAVRLPDQPAGAVPAGAAVPAASAASAASAAAAGIAALRNGEPWTIGSAVDSATVRYASSLRPAEPAHWQP